MPARRSTAGAAHPFRVIAIDSRGETSHDTRITIRDGWDEVQVEEYGEASATLPQGLYTVHLERAGAVSEKVVRHTADTSLRENEPRRTSAMPSFDTVDAHEYYSYTAAELSQRDTGSAATVLPDDGHGAGRLFVFVRAAEAGAHEGRELADGLFLHAPDGDRITDFGTAVVEQDHEVGWLAFSAPARAGSYALRFAGLGAREMVVTVFAGWETQLFIPFEHRPRLEHSSVLMAHLGQGYHPDDRVAQAIDAGLAGLRGGIDLLPRETRQMLLSGKFENPMLGLIGAHLLLLQPNPDFGLLDIVLHNLEELLPGSADVHAVRLAAALRHGSQPPLQPMDTPPMLHRGLVAIMEASAVIPAIVPENGWLERIAPHVLSDSAWTTWSLPEAVTAAATPDQLSRMAGAAVASAMAPSRKRHSAIDIDSSDATRIAAEVLTSVLSHAGTGSEAGLERGLAEVSRPGAARVLDHARSRGAPAMRKATQQLVMDGVDTAVRTAMEQQPVAEPTADIPVWVRELLLESRERGTLRDLATIARQARLPLGMLQRALQRLG
jgi:hypothetical protein